MTFDPDAMIAEDYAAEARELADRWRVLIALFAVITHVLRSGPDAVARAFGREHMSPEEYRLAYRHLAEYRDNTIRTHGLRELENTDYARFCVALWTGRLPLQGALGSLEALTEDNLGYFTSPPLPGSRTWWRSRWRRDSTWGQGSRSDGRSPLALEAATNRIRP